MSTATIENSTRTEDVVASVAASARPAVDAPVRRPRRPGPGVGPAARPSGPVRAPSVRVVRPAQARSCLVEVPPVRRRSWQLTERAVALVLVLAVLIATAAVVVVTLTALRVTGDGADSLRGLHAGAAQQSSSTDG